MARKRSGLSKQAAELDSLAKRAADLIERWGVKHVGGNAALPIQYLAQQYGISQVRFEPLLSSAGIRVDGEKFEVILNTELVDPRAQPGSLLSLDEPERWAVLNPRARFTVAHEIVHAMLFKLKGEHHATVFRDQVDKLESLCSELARIVLLPKALLTASSNPVSTEFLAELARRACVSPEVVIRRLYLRDAGELLGARDFLLAYARWENDQVKIVSSLVSGVHASSFFRRSIQTSFTSSGKVHQVDGSQLSALVGNQELDAIVRSTGFLSQAIAIPYSSGMHLPCTVEVSPYYSKSCFLRIDVDAPVRAAEQPAALF